MKPINIEMIEPTLSRPAAFASIEHYFDWCALNVRFWADRVKRNRKTAMVNQKLAVWHRENPDTVSVAAWRMERARRRQV